MVAPLLAYGIPAAVAGLGSYFGGMAQEDAAKRSTEESRRQFDETMRQRVKEYNDMIASKKAAGGIIGTGYNTSGYGQTLNYTNPYQTGMDTSINAMLSGGLTSAELTQQARDIATAGQGINAGAATMGLPAGARAALLGKSTENITGGYANRASDRIGQGVQLATGAAGTGANIANMNFQANLSNFLKQQELQNEKTRLLAGAA